MAEAAPSVGVEDVWEQKKAAMARYYVKDWIERHSAPHFETDLWLVVTDENGKQTRVPACRAVLNINCHFLHSFQAGDDLEIPQTICADAVTVVYFLWLNYPQFTIGNNLVTDSVIHGPFDLLPERVFGTHPRAIINDEGHVADLCLAITKLAKLAHWILCDTTIARLQIIMYNILHRVPRVKATKYLYLAAFAMSDAQDKDCITYLVHYNNLQKHDAMNLVEEFPAAFLSMNEAEREQIAGHVVPMFDAFLKGCPRQLPRNTHTGHYDTHVNIPDNVRRPAERGLSRLADVTTFLLDFYEKARSGPA